MVRSLHSAFCILHDEYDVYAYLVNDCMKNRSLFDLLAWHRNRSALELLSCLSKVLPLGSCLPLPHPL